MQASKACVAIESTIYGTRAGRLLKTVSRFLASLIIFASMMQAGIANAQSISQGWAGIVAGSNDYSNPVPYGTAQDACSSLQNSVVPAFGFEVFGLLSVTPEGNQINPFSGVLAPLTNCTFDAGPNGTPTIGIFFGCTGGDKLVNAACLPGDYPVTAEPTDCPACKGTAGQFPVTGDPVAISSGSKVEVATDYTSGGPYPIEIKRYYRSLQMPTDGTSRGLGIGWGTDLTGRRLRVEDTSVGSPFNVVVTRGDGQESRFLNPFSDPNTLGPWNQFSMEVFLQNGEQFVQGVGDAKDKLKTVGFFVFEYTDENDRVDTIKGGGSTLADAAGPTKSVWKGGYTRNYVYASDDGEHLRPIQINDSLGRVVNITWNGNLISEIDAPDGTRIQYSYQALNDSSGQPVPGTEVLTQVARYKADGTPIDSTTYQYDRSRTSTTVPLLTGVLDAKGVLVDSTTYDDSGRVLTAQGPGGVDATTIAYDDVASTRTVTNALGQVSVYTMVPTGGFGSSIHPILKLTQIARQQSATVPAATLTQSNNSGFLDSRTDFNGIVTTYIYDSTGNETKRVEDANGVARTITTTWSPNFRLPTQIVSPNLTINFTYDSSGNLTQRQELDTTNARKPVGRTWNYTYNPLGLLTSVTGPRTDVTQTTSYTYDPNGNLQTVTDALNHVTTVNAVNAAGLPTSVSDANGVVTLLSYDPLGRISTVSVQGPAPATTTFGYDVNGLLTSLQAANGVTLTYGYDDAHRLTNIRDSAGNAMAFALDGLGNHVQTQVQNGSAQVLMAHSATFDTLGRLLTSIGAANQTTAYQYDNNGNLTKLIDPRSAVTQTAFDGLNRVIQTTDALNGVTKLAYNAQDNVTSATDPKLHATTYTVNAFGFVTQVASPDSGTTSYTYDPAGNVLTRTDARKIVTTYTYDALDRPLTRKYSATAENVAYGYDSAAGGNFGIGRLTSVTDAAGTASFVYDAYGNRISENRTIAGINYSTTYAYDLAGNMTKITYPSGMIVNYQRDALGQVSGATMQTSATAQPVTLASNIGYLPFGPMQTLTLGNGVQLTNSYDLDYRVTEKKANAAATLQDLSLSYDPANNISSITDAVTPSLAQTFQYDPLGRVTQGVGPYGTDNYTYDPLGNRLTRSLVNGGTTTSTTYTYTSTNNQLASAVSGSTTLSYTYDANGARSAIKNGHSTTAAYTYNNDARLATAGSATLKYDAFGERSVETITGGGTHFIFAKDGTLLAEQTTTGALVRNYVYLNGHPLALVDGTGTVSYVLDDQVGQPQKMLNASGAVSWQRVAGIFGDTVSQPVGNTGSNPLRFPGQWFDANAGGLHYNYFRDYDPATGRYLETDPIGLTGGINDYAYVGGNPVTRSDFEGLKVTVIATDTSVADALMQAYYRLNQSKSGRAITEPLERSPLDYQIRPVHEDAFYCPPGAGGKCQDRRPRTVYLEPCERIMLPTTKGMQPTPLEIVLAHELGHAHGVSDDGPGRMNNVNANENPVRRDLGYPARTSYTVPRIIWVP
jgi:RHS repeat-associated protein